jgi:hypothetical protein
MRSCEAEQPGQVPPHAQLRCTLGMASNMGTACAVQSEAA